MLHSRQHQVEVVIIPWEAGGAPGLRPQLSPARLASERGGVFLHWFVRHLPHHPRPASSIWGQDRLLPGAQCPAQGWGGGLGQGDRPRSLSPCGVDVWVPGEWFCTSAVPLTPGGTASSQVCLRSTWCAWGQAGGSWSVSSQGPPSPGASPECSVYARLGGRASHEVGRLLEAAGTGQHLYHLKAGALWAGQ